MANNHFGIPMPRDQQASSLRRRTTHTLNPLSQRHSSIVLPFKLQRQPQNRQPTHMPNPHEGEVDHPILSNVSDGPGPDLPEERQQATPPPASAPEGQSESAAASQLQQDQQPTEVPVPPARDPGPPQVRRPSNTPAPVPQREQQQATLPAPTPRPEGQSGSAAASQQQQDQQSTEVPVPPAREPGPRNQPRQRQPSPTQRNRAYSPERPYIIDPPADDRGIASYILNPMPWIHAIFNTAGNWICKVWTAVKDHSWAVLQFLTTILKWISIVLEAVISNFRKIMIILVILVGCVWYPRVGEIVCSPVNSFCELRYNLLRPIICPVEMCMADPNPSTSGTVAAAPSLGLGDVIPEGDREAKLKDSEYIRSLFRIPYALDWARKSLKEQPFYIQKSSMPDEKKVPLATSLTHIMLDMETMTRGIKQFNLDYIHAVRIIHRHIRLFEDVFIKIINDYAGSTSPDRGFLRYHHHHTSAAGSWEGINAFVRRAPWMLTNERDRDGAETVNATMELQSRFEDFVNSSVSPLHSLNYSACGIRSALSPLQERLTNFTLDAADSVHNNQNEEKHKKDTGGGLSYSWGNWYQAMVERALKKEKNENEFSWIGADATLLKRCEGDLVNALRVLDGVNSRISNAEIAIEHLGRRLHELSEKDMHDGWGSASVKILTQELKGFMRWMDGGGVDLEELNKKAEEEEYKKWNKPMSLWY